MGNSMSWNSTSNPDDGSNGNEGTMPKGEGCRVLGDVMKEGEGRALSTTS
jgi:hypothetical protein